MLLPIDIRIITAYDRLCIRLKERPFLRKTQVPERRRRVSFLLRFSHGTILLPELIISYSGSKCTLFRGELQEKALLNLADARPLSRAAMLAIPGFGPGLWSKYGLEILNILSSVPSDDGGR